MQRGRGGAPAPIGVVYHTSMTRPDAALALAALYGASGRNEARVGAVCVGGSGLDAAVFCDVVGRFYIPGARNGNQALPVGLAITNPPQANPPMVKSAIERRKGDNTPQYVRSINAESDTSLAEAVLRNGVTFNAESVVVLSAPATWLARTLDLHGTVDEYKKRVKRLVIVNTGAAERDPAALRRIVAEWPTPVFYCGPDVGQALRFPGARLDEVFKWAPAHPVVDAYKAYKAAPHDEPLFDLAALGYAIKPDEGLFDVSDAGALTVGGDGQPVFLPGSGNVRRISVPEGRAAAILEVLVTAAATAPPTPARGRGVIPPG